MDAGLFKTNHMSSEKVYHHEDALVESYGSSEDHHDNYDGSTGRCVEHNISKDKNLALELYQSCDSVTHSLVHDACSTVPVGDMESTTTSSAAYCNSPSSSVEPLESPSIGFGSVSCNKDHEFLADEILSNDVNCFTTNLNHSNESKFHEQTNDKTACEVKENNIESKFQSDVKTDNCYFTESCQSDSQTNDTTLSQERTSDIDTLSCENNILTISSESKIMSQVTQKSELDSLIEKDAMAESNKTQYTAGNTDDEEEFLIKSQEDNTPSSDSDEKVNLFGRDSPPGGDKIAVSLLLPSLHITSPSKEIDTVGVFTEEIKKGGDGFEKSDLQERDEAKECEPVFDQPLIDTLAEPKPSNSDNEQTVRENNEFKASSFERPLETEILEDSQTNDSTLSQERKSDINTLSCDNNKLAISSESKNMSQVIQKSDLDSLIEKDVMMELTKTQYTTGNTDDEERFLIKSQEDNAPSSDSDERVNLFERDLPPGGDKTASLLLPSLHDVTSRSKKLNTVGVFNEEIKKGGDGFEKSDLLERDEARKYDLIFDHPLIDTLKEPKPLNSDNEQTVRENNEFKASSFERPLEKEILKEQRNVIADAQLHHTAQKNESGSRNDMEGDSNIDHTYREAEMSKTEDFEIKNKGDVFEELVVQQSDMLESELEKTSVPDVLSCVTVETSHNEEINNTNDNYHWCENERTESEMCSQSRARYETLTRSNASFGESETEAIWSSSTDPKDASKDDDLDFTIEINEDYDGCDEIINDDDVEIDLSHAQDKDRNFEEIHFPERQFPSENSRDGNTKKESEPENQDDVSYSSGTKSHFKLRPVECFQNNMAVESNRKKLLHDHTYYKTFDKVFGLIGGKGYIGSISLMGDEVAWDHTYYRKQTIMKYPDIYHPHPQLSEFGSENNSLNIEDRNYDNVVLEDHSYQKMKEDMFVAHGPLIDSNTDDKPLTLQSSQTTRDEDAAVPVAASQTALDRDRLFLETKKGNVSVKTILNRPEHSKDSNPQAVCEKQGTFAQPGTQTDLKPDKMLLVTRRGIVSLSTAVHQSVKKQSQLSKDDESQPTTQEENKTGDTDVEYDSRKAQAKVVIGPRFRYYSRWEYERCTNVPQMYRRILDVKDNTYSKKVGLHRPHPQVEVLNTNESEAEKKPVMVHSAKSIQTSASYAGYIVQDEVCKFENSFDKEAQTYHKFMKPEEDAKPEKKEGDINTSICQTIIPSDVTSDTFNTGRSLIPSKMPPTLRKFYHISKRNLKGAYLVHEAGGGCYVFKRLSSFHLKDGVYLEAVFNNETDKQLAQHIGTIIQDPFFKIIENVPFIKLESSLYCTALRLWKLSSYTEYCQAAEMPLKIGAVFSLRPDRDESENSDKMSERMTDQPVILKHKMKKIYIDVPKLGKSKDNRCQQIIGYDKLNRYDYRLSIPLDEVEFWSKYKNYYDPNSDTKLRKYCRVVLKSLNPLNQHLGRFQDSCSKRCRQKMVCLSLIAKKPKLMKEMQRLCNDFKIPLNETRLTKEKYSSLSNVNANAIKMEPDDTDVDVCNDSNEDQGLFARNQLEGMIDRGERSVKNDSSSDIDTDLSARHVEHVINFRTNEVEVTLKEVPNNEWGGAYGNQTSDKKDESQLCTRTIKEEPFSEGYGELSNTTQDSNSRKRRCADDNYVYAPAEDVVKTEQVDEHEREDPSPNKIPCFESHVKCERVSQFSEAIPSTYQGQNEQIDSAKGIEMGAGAGLEARIRNLREQLKQREKDLDAMKENMKHFTDLPV